MNTMWSKGASRQALMRTSACNRLLIAAVGNLTSLEVLDCETRVDLDMLPRNARVLRQQDKHVRAVLEIRLQEVSSLLLDRTGA